jgi:hypothetical protein
MNIIKRAIPSIAILPAPRRRLLREYHEMQRNKTPGGWKAIACRIGINVRYVYGYAVYGKEPENMAVRKALGLKIVCPMCNRRMPPVHPNPTSIVDEALFDPTAPRPEFVSPDEPVRRSLTGAFFSAKSRCWLSPEEFFRELAPA